jgi:hypothetical protein
VPDGRITRWTACVRVRIASAPWRRMVVMSPPEQKVPPAPVSTMTRTASSAIASSIASASTTRNSRSMAFLVAGRFSVSTRI